MIRMLENKYVAEMGIARQQFVYGWLVNFFSGHFISTFWSEMFSKYVISDIAN